ncbi:MAG: PilZ domain-containing protein [Vicinamibacterales bacterium]
MVDHAVLIAAADLLPALKARLAAEVRDLTAFTDAEALRALEVITTKRPGTVLLEKRFAATPRGAALINRIKADPSLVDTRIDVLAPDGQADGAGATPPAAAAPPAAVPPPQLDYRGTRRAPRVNMPDTCELLVDGNRGTIVDLSTLGAQLLTATVLKPNQRVRVSLADDVATMRCSATVVWASFEIPKGSTPRYRAGLEFIEPDTTAVDAYIGRHPQPAKS